MTEEPRYEYLCPKCITVGAMHDHVEWRLCDKHDNETDDPRYEDGDYAHDSAKEDGR